MRRWSTHASRVLPEFIGWWTDTDYVVGWLHSKAGHQLKCQLDFCSMFKPETGRMPAENMEQVHVSGVSEVAASCFCAALPI
jgi:hypothetical protein